MLQNVLALQIDSQEADELARKLQNGGDEVDQMMLLAVVAESVAAETGDDVMERLADKFRRAVEKRRDELQDLDEDDDYDEEWRH
jgi:hypothetical protein